MNHSKRIAVLSALISALGVAPAFAQLTPMPNPLIQWFTNAGAVATGYGLCVFVSGTSNLATTYEDAGGAIENSNPILFDSSGRPTSGGVFLEPGNAYRFILKNFTGVETPTCVPDSGVTIWTVNGVEAVPGGGVGVDVTATTAVTVNFGDMVYLSDGQLARNAGQWYFTDSDSLITSTNATLIGMVSGDDTIEAGELATVRIQGAVDVNGPLSPGEPYFLSGTAGGLTATAPVNALRAGFALDADTFVVSRMDGPQGPSITPCGRLTLTTQLPVTVTDVTSANFIFYTPYGGCNKIPLWNGSFWETASFSQLTSAAPGGTGVYDVFIYNSSGTLTLDLTAWTNDTTRATSLTSQDNVLVKAGAMTRLYLGTFRVVAGVIDDTRVKRHVWNYYNRVRRPILYQTSDVTWNYTVATWQQANANAANLIEVVVGWPEVNLNLRVSTTFSNTNADVNAMVGIGQDSTTTPLDTGLGVWSASPAAGAGLRIPTAYEINIYPAVGRHVYNWLEWSEATGTTTWQGNNGPSGATHVGGMIGWIEG